MQDSKTLTPPAQPLANCLAEYADKLQFGDLPAPVVHEVKRRFIDSIATAVGAMNAEAYAIARRCALRVQGDPGAAMFGGGRSSVEWATFVNGLLIRYLDYNDTYLSLEPAHPSDNLSATLTVGDMVNATGRDLITAAVLAYEIQCRLCDAASLRKRGYDHVTYGAISSAAAACKLLKLDPARTTHAIGLAGVANVALRQTRSGELSMWKGCAFANASRNGLFAALLAADGMSGPERPFEGTHGLMDLITGPFELQPLPGAGDGPFRSPEVRLKYWPVEYNAQLAVWAARELRERVDWRELESIELGTYRFAYTEIGSEPEKWDPLTRETADHSLPYLFAWTLVHGEVGLDAFEARSYRDPALRPLMNRIRVREDDEINALYPETVALKVDATTRDGRRLFFIPRDPLGHVRNPMGDRDVQAKFLGAAEPVLGRERAAEALERWWNLQSIADLSEALDLLTPSS
jgi:2-methylcitrate dehydratase